MPRIFDNIDQYLLPTLRSALEVAERADFCVGYFNLRGWRKVDDLIEKFQGGDKACRLLVGMQTLPQEELYQSKALIASGHGIDNNRVIQFKRQIAEEFRKQLTIGTPTNDEESGLRRLSRQIKAKKVVVKLFLKHSLHAKLYLAHRNDRNNPTVAILGSSNLTLSGLEYQGELNVDVLDHDACDKLKRWFDDRWDDHWCFDISEELVALIDESWAREDLILPYHIYLKIAYHLSQEARIGLSEYRIPRDVGDTLFDFQRAAVQIAAHHVNRRGGVLIGDVVGLGKTLIAATLARILQEDFFLETLIICPKTLVSMWQDYVDRYRLLAKVLPLSRVQNELPDLRRYRVVLIDESHNLRNREGKRYRAIQEYIAANESRCILLSATPYNKTYLDLSAQLRLFVPEDKDLGVRPEALLSEIGGELEFIRRHQAPVRSLAAFEQSEHPDDWRELMRLYMVRRTRSFIQTNYAKLDEPLPLEQELGKEARTYLEFADGRRAYFPIRQPQTIKFSLGEGNDPYASLYSDEVVETINHLNLPRYGLGNYVASTKRKTLTESEERQIKGLSRAGKRLMGFSRTNLFKRLESGGPAFIQSIDRHILRNYIFLHAIEQTLDLPIGTQEAALLDSRNNDEDAESILATLLDPEIEEEDELTQEEVLDQAESDYRQRAAQVYRIYATRYQRRFKWIQSKLLKPSLKKDLQADAKALTAVLTQHGKWLAHRDTKLAALVELLTQKHSHEKVLVFTQFADTVRYLSEELKRIGLTHIEGVTGNSENPAAIAWQFSPVSNGKSVSKDEELRVLIATDVLSEGLNLQDCAIIVNYDLPWAIIRLIQRAGRVDRIGQTAANILCYSFLPAEGVERIIRLRSRLRQRLQENAEVVGTDETFFEDEMDAQAFLDLYHEKAGVYDGAEDSEVDLTSEAYQIWKNATDADPALKKTIENLAPVVYSTRDHAATPTQPEGVLLYMKTAEGNDSLALVDRQGRSVTQSQLAILRLAQCLPDTPARPRDPQHHELVAQGAKLILEEEKSTGGQLGRPSGARFRTYERLKRHAQAVRGTLFESKDLLMAIDQIYRYPLRQSAIDQLNRQLRSGINDQQLAELVVALYQDDRLCLVQEEVSTREPQIICSMGLFARGLEGND
ncbi:MAG: NgoFVII family restriction endonuclease [Drouetiella hepatica Uher 2000/2452]|jgi:SNF2 family DNA or RNA helicase|uniref:NgoFVII family restriction endonuclease n=1 Tax=Drouetiella hepatica Uher 2000/2452 TaxID=904376 RepID=A0A951UPY9_9CYAN|nr:NgoFVII family restriction endonuclease [Drouetiella hepatica Uher 2000/2452]